MIKQRIITKKLIFLFCLFIISTLSLGMNKLEDNLDGKIFKNIYIENIDVGKMNIHEASKQISNTYKLKPINIKYISKKWTINPKDIKLDYNIDKSLQNAYSYTRSDNSKENLKRIFNLTFKEKYKIELIATYDEIALSKLIENISKEINREVKQASIQVTESSQILKTPSKEGIEVDIVKLKEEIYNMLDKKDIKEIELPTRIIKPTTTTEDVDSVNTILGQYSTSFNDNTPRGSNIHVAGQSTSDILIMPGETFSYNKSTGARTWSNGYKTAKVIVGGRYVNGEGGGVCQVSTTIYNAALLAGMEIEEVHNHTFASRYAPRGKDAAVSYGYTDLKFKNPFSHPIYIKNIVSNGAITSKIYGCKQDREKLYIRTEEKYNKDKINVKTYRIYLDEENNKIREELIAESKYKIK
ncbi:VanW family protein [Clostridium sp. CCUG 7971]|uniref:VanW family protein n=1 Tax=Clostridium sp. CCUG 7971 TaxID=2811414 RepID=UPI001ABAB6CF|nr:VanW family protein [Clostridium sp. CCUG 7971]MBO3446032.1 VanW family protein [Clostridium sp. CCUG 7971]